jgi:hypothetical protein
MWRQEDRESGEVCSFDFYGSFVSFRDTLHQRKTEADTRDLGSLYAFASVKGLKDVR